MKPRSERSRVIHTNVYPSHFIWKDARVERRKKIGFNKKNKLRDPERLRGDMVETFSTNSTTFYTVYIDKIYGRLTRWLVLYKLKLTASNLYIITKFHLPNKTIDALHIFCIVARFALDFSTYFCCSFLSSFFSFYFIFK